MDVLLVVALAVAAAYYCQRCLFRRLHIPPGPKSLPIIGNLHQMPTEAPQQTFAQWTNSYGDVAFASILGTPLVILGSLQAARDLLDKRSAKYSDRSRTVLLTELVGWDHDLALLPYGDEFRKHRKWYHTALLDKATLSSYVPLQRNELVSLLSGMIETPDAFVNHIKRYTAAVILGITYGYSVTSVDDALVNLINRAAEGTIETGAAGAAVVDFFPILKHLPTWFPGARFKRHALQVRSLVREVHTRPYEMVKAQLAEGKARPSFVANLIEDASQQGVLEEEQESIMGAGAMIYVAAFETTNTTMLTFLLAMVLHSDVYRKLQEELDRVVGSDRLPDESDMKSLPYLECVLKETYRWNPPIPLGVPHRSMEDDEYRGYHIPKGSIMIANLWGIAQDPNLYPQPDAFRPERWQEMDASTAEAADPRNIVFGYGRRICPGRLIAESSILLLITNIAAMFDVQAPKDDSGNPVMPMPKFNTGLTSCPDDFACVITPRSKKAAELIAQIKTIT